MKNNDVDFNKIKLIIWDLDETFWNGVLSEGPINPIPDNLELVKNLSYRGIVNSICSKNTKKQVEQELKNLNIIDYFVFNSIDWTPKGERIAKQIKDMSLRAINVLFIDDNLVNLNEAQFYSKDLMIAEPTIIPDLIAWVASVPVLDKSLKRLNQYKILEIKHREQAEYSDNTAFLYSTNTRVSIFHNCLDEIDRISELVLRTNQLNFTKVRSTKEELIELINNRNVDSGYVKVKDRFGDYGIVGFYALIDGECKHFLFSCRTIGQGVEQYVYSIIGYPIIHVVGEVISKLTHDPAPAWINQNNREDNAAKEKSLSGKIVFKGPCDMILLTQYFNTKNVISEFTYQGERNNSVELHNHSVNYLSFPFLSPNERKELLDECVFSDAKMFDTALYDDDVSLVFLSTLIEPNLGIYKNKSNNRLIAYGEWREVLTEEDNWPGFINGTLHTYQNSFTIEWLKEFRQKYEYIGQESPEAFLENLKLLISRLSPNVVLCLILGSEMPYEKNDSITYEGREEYHKHLNYLLREMAKTNSRIRLLDFNDFIEGQDDFIDNINHFQRSVYYKASIKANEIIEETLGYRLKESSHFTILVNRLASRISKIMNPKTQFYRTLRGLYHKVRIFF